MVNLGQLGNSRVGEDDSIRKFLPNPGVDSTFFLQIVKSKKCEKKEIVKVYKKQS